MMISSRRRNRRSGASLVEFAFVAPLMLMFLLAAFEYARFLFTLQLVNNAAREGARYAAVNTATDTTASVQTYVDNYLAGQGGTQFVGYTPASNISVYLADPITGANTMQPWQNASWGNVIGVSITGTYQPIVPGMYFFTSSLTVTGTCLMTVEAN